LILLVFLTAGALTPTAAELSAACHATHQTNLSCALTARNDDAATGEVPTAAPGTIDFVRLTSTRG